MSRARTGSRALAVALNADVHLAAYDIGMRLVAWSLGVSVARASVEPRKGTRIPIAPGMVWHASTGWESRQLASAVAFELRAIGIVDPAFAVGARQTEADALAALRGLDAGNLRRLPAWIVQRVTDHAHAATQALADRLHYRSPAARRTACGVWLFPHAHVAFTAEPDAAIVEWAEGRGCGTCANAARDELKRRAS